MREEMFTIEDALNVCMERIDYWSETRNKKFAPEGAYFSRHDMVEKAMFHFYLALPTEIASRPEEERPNNKTWYFRCAKPEEYDEDDRIFFTKEVFTKAIDDILEPMANLDPRRE